MSARADAGLGQQPADDGNVVGMSDLEKALDTLTPRSLAAEAGGTPDDAAHISALKAKRASARNSVISASAYDTGDERERAAQRIVGRVARRSSVSSVAGGPDIAALEDLWVDEPEHEGPWQRFRKYGARRAGDDAQRGRRATR